MLSRARRVRKGEFVTIFKHTATMLALYSLELQRLRHAAFTTVAFERGG